MALQLWAKQVDYLYDRAGVFTIQLMVIDNAGATSVMAMDIEAEDLVLSLEKEEWTTGIKVFPNPIKDHIVLICQEPTNHLFLSIASISGKSLIEHQFSHLPQSHEIKIEVPYLSKGVYLVTIETALGVRSYRMMKQ